MNIKNVDDLRMLRKALEEKAKNPNSPDFHTMRYEGTSGIYRSFKHYLQEWQAMSNKLGLNYRLNDYRDIEKPEVLEKFVRRLKTDPQLRFFNNPESFLDKAEIELPKELHEELQRGVATEKGVFEKSVQVPSIEQPVPNMSAGASTQSNQSSPPDEGSGLGETPQAPSFSTSSFGPGRESPKTMASTTEKELESEKTKTTKAPEETRSTSKSSQSSQTSQSPSSGQAPASTSRSTSSSSSSRSTSSSSASGGRAATTVAPSAHVPTVNIPSVPLGGRKLPYTLRNGFNNLLSQGGILSKKALGSTLDGLSSMAKRTLGPLYPGGLGTPSGFINQRFPNFGGGFMGAGNSRLLGRLSSSSRSLTTKIKGSAGKKFAIALLLAMSMTGIITFSGAGAPTPSAEAGPLGSDGSISSDITSCMFTRASNPQPIKSAQLAQWINQAASQYGIPPAVLASVAMHENQGFLTSKDDSATEIKTNRFCIDGSPFCEKAGQNIHMGECSSAEIAGGARTGTAKGLMQIVDIFNPGKDLCSISESLAIAAQKLKNDGISSLPSQEQVTNAVHSYYNSCVYGGYSYCDEVWQDLQKCSQSSSIATPGVGTPSVVTSANQLGGELRFSSPAVAGCAMTKWGYPASYHCLSQSEMTKYNQPGLVGDEDYLQCTEFVWAVFDKAGLGKEILLIKNNDAGDWAQAAKQYPNTFEVFTDARQLQKGDIISLAGTSSGASGGNSHVAVVTDRGDNQVTVAQAATDARFEVWKIDMTNGQLDPFKAAHTATRGFVRGFIRVIGKT